MSRHTHRCVYLFRNSRPPTWFVVYPFTSYNHTVGVNQCIHTSHEKKIRTTLSTQYVVHLEIEYKVISIPTKVLRNCQGSTKTRCLVGRGVSPCDPTLGVRGTKRITLRIYIPISRLGDLGVISIGINSSVHID